MLTELQAAGILGCHPGTLGNWRLRERGPPFVRRLERGRTVVRYPEGKLREWARKEWTETNGSPQRAAPPRSGMPRQE